MPRPATPPPLTHVLSGTWPNAELDGEVGAEYCQHLAAVLVKRLADLGWSYRELERQSGVSYRAISQVANGLSAPDLRTIARLEVALRTDLLPRRRRASHDA
jgi:hypothetical protein